MIEALERPKDMPAFLSANKRSLKDFAFPEDMRRLVYTENAYQMRDEELLALIKERFPDEPHPSIRTVQTWRQDAKREWDEQRLAVVSKVLQRSANRIVPNAVAGLYAGFLNALDLLETSTQQGNLKVRVQALGRVNELGNNLLNQFRGGEPEGQIDLLRAEREGVRLLMSRGLTEEQAKEQWETMVGAYQAALPEPESDGENASPHPG